MQNNKWKFIGVIGQVHDLDAKRLVFETHKIENKKVVRHVVEMHNEGKSLKEIDTYLLDAECTQDDREFIVESIYAYFATEYEFRAVLAMEEGDDSVESIPLDHVNVDEHHEVINIGLYRRNNDGTQDHILDISKHQLNQLKGVFMGYRYKGGQIL